jgi:oligopeptide transport system substrate-binding protein
MISKRERTTGAILLAGATLVFSAGCASNGLFTSATATPAAPTATPFSAQAFLQAAGKDALSYASRYFTPDGAISLDAPSGWVFNQQPDTGTELDSISEKYGAAPVGAIYTLGKIERDQNIQQVMDGFLKMEAIAARQISVGDQSDFAPAAGPGARKITGTIKVKPDQEVRESCELIAFSNSTSAYVLAAYPDRSSNPTAFTAEFEAAAKSLKWEETRPIDTDETNTLQLALPEPETLDPARTLDGAGGIVGDVFSGLVALDPSLQARPELAERWDVTPDGLTYTFHLRTNAKFHNGRSVTADDVLFSWLRAAGPGLNSPTAMRYLGDILGIDDYHAGKTDSIAGLKAVDSQTIQVTLDGVKPYFLLKLTYPASWIVDRYNVRLPNWEVNPVGTGPFRMIQQLPDRNVILEANPNYYGTPPQLKNLFYWLLSRDEDGLYKSGKSDRMRITSDLLPNVRDPHDPLFGNVSVQEKLCTNFIMFNTAIPPFDDPLVRKAFSLAVNREVFVEVTSAEGDLPAGGILPPGMPGYVAEPARTPYDPEEAKRLIQQSRYFNGSQTPPPIRFTLPSGLSGEYDSTMDFLITAWQKNLGIDVFIEGVTNNAYLEIVQNTAAEQLIFTHHCADYPDPENFYDYLFHGDNAGVYFGYRSDALDAILNSAAVEKDWSRRIELYRQADGILYDDAPAIFLSYDGPVYVVWKPYVMGYTPALIDIPQHQFMWFQRE